MHLEVSLDFWYQSTFNLELYFARSGSCQMTDKRIMSKIYCKFFLRYLNDAKFKIDRI